jgi:hypothetical protein
LPHPPTANQLSPRPPPATWPATTPYALRTAKSANTIRTPLVFQPLRNNPMPLPFAEPVPARLDADLHARALKPPGPRSRSAQAPIESAGLRTVGQIVGTDWIIAKSSIKSMDDGGEGLRHRSTGRALETLWKRECSDATYADAISASVRHHLNPTAHRRRQCQCCRCRRI